MYELQKSGEKKFRHEAPASFSDEGGEILGEGGGILKDICEFKSELLNHDLLYKCPIYKFFR